MLNDYLQLQVVISGLLKAVANMFEAQNYSAEIWEAL